MSALPRVPRYYLALLLVAAAAACGDDHAGGDIAPEAEAALEVEADGAPDSGADVAVDGAEDAPDVGPETIDAIAEVEVEAFDAGDDALDVEAIDGGETVDAVEVEVGPRACDDFEACDELVDGEGVCPGTCRSTDDTLRCTGTVKHAVCHATSPVDVPTEVVDYGDFTVTPVTWPRDAVLGESYDFEVRIRNDTQATLTVPFRWKNPQTFSFEGASWESIDGFQLGVGASAPLTARITALQPTTLTSGANLIVTFVFGEEPPFEPRSTVHFPDTEAIACGGEHFPESWCPGEGCYESRAFYVSARCCDDVFFPSASCCDDTGCFGGACVDGKCVFDAPYLSSANNAPIGNQRIRLVLVDTHPQFTDPCADHYQDAKTEFDFATVEAWYDDLSQRRIGRNAVDFRWIVTGGVATTDFLTGPNYWDDYSRELNAWLEQRGCPIFDAYDKVIVSSSTVDLMGFGGFYTSRGHIAVFSAHGPYLLAHELAHSFGATDLYLDLGGVFLYPNDLMGNFLGGPPHPGDQVAWGEMGFGDVDRNGIVDVVELAAFPETIAIANATATITAKGSLEIRWEFVASEGDVPRRVVIPTWFIEVPAANAAFEQTYPGRWKVVTFDGTQVDLAAIEAAGVLAVTVRATYRFTDRDWNLQTLNLDEVLQIPVTVSR